MYLLRAGSAYTSSCEGAGLLKGAVHMEAGSARAGKHLRYRQTNAWVRLKKKRFVLLGYAICGSVILLCFILSACQNYQPDTTPDTGSPGPTVSDTSSNGISGEPTQADFGDKYDFMDFVFMSYTGANSYYTACKSAIKGGALLYDCYKFFYSDTSVFINADTNEEPEEWIGLYDEESNSLIPLCFASACTHDAARKDDKCFAQRFYGADSVYWFGVSDGSVFIINSSLVASYYSLEGALLSSVKYSSNDKYRCGILDFVFCEAIISIFHRPGRKKKCAESLADGSSDIR